MVAITEPSRSELTKVTGAAVIGTALDYYDFFLAATIAGFVWPPIFYPHLSSAQAAALSVGIADAIYLTRPVGAYVFGNLGDRLGRRTMLVWTLATMGVATFGLAFTPPFQAAGIFAPILLAIFRLTQGLGIGGEYGGATTWVSEFASKSRWRVFWSGWVQMALLFGGILSSLALAITTSSLSQSAFASYGWRILFVLGGLVTAVAVIVRYRLAESPLFKELKEKRAVERMPANKALREQLGKILLLAVAFNFAISSYAIMIVPYSIGYMVAYLKLTPALVTSYLTIALVLIIPVGLAGMFVGNLINKKVVVILGALIGGIVAYPYFLLLNTRSPLLIVLAIILANGSAWFGSIVAPAFLTEQFPTRYRYSGAGLSFQISGLIVGIISAALLPLILLRFGGFSAWPYVAAVAAALSFASVIAILFTKEKQSID